MVPNACRTLLTRHVVTLARSNPLIATMRTLADRLGRAMSDPLRSALTDALATARTGDRHAASHLVRLVYAELRELAASMLSRLPPGQTLQATALVHEAYLRVARADEADWDNRRHFFAAAAQAMREILVCEARRKFALKRGGGRRRVDLDEESLRIEPPSADVLALDEALSELERDDERKAKVVLLRFYAGLTMEEIARTLDVSLATVEREWRFVRVWLQRRLAND